MSNFPLCSEAQIRAWVGERSLRLGREYVEAGDVTDTTIREGELRAKVQGTADRPYRVWVTFGADGTTFARCSCPVGDDGTCKHVGAVLLTWHDDPDAFAVCEPLETALEQRSKSELAALIRLMIKHEPDLESLIDVPLLGTCRGATATPEAFRKQAQAAMRRAGGEWGWHADAAEQLEAMRELGEQFLKEGDDGSAMAVFAGVAQAVDDDAIAGDEAGDMIGVVRACAAGLGRCLAAATDPKRRESILQSMFEIYTLDLAVGGIGMSDGVPQDIMKHATPDERRLVGVWVRDQLPDAHREWGRQVLGEFLLELEKDRLTDEAYVRVCRQTGRLVDLVTRLLKLGREDEAAAAARDAEDHELLKLADVMAAHGRAEMAETLVDVRARGSKNVPLLEWLCERARRSGNGARELELSLAIYRNVPTLDRYKELRGLARQQGRWDSLRQRLLIGLKRDHRDGPPPLLVEICLLEGDVDQALDLIKPRQRRAGGLGLSAWGWGTALELKVARAAESTRPEVAIDVYRRCAERQIEQRSRTGYQQACELLARAKSLHRRLGSGAAWDDYLTGLRLRFKSLRALKEEMTAAGL